MTGTVWTDGMRVDVHHHAIPETLLQLYAKEPDFGVKVEHGRWRGESHVDFDLGPEFYDPGAKLSQLERLGLEGAVLSVSPTDFHYDVETEMATAAAKATNVGLAEMAAGSPDRLSWMASVPLQDGSAAAATLEEAVGEGACGVEIGTSLPDLRLDQAELDPFWAAAERSASPIMLHPAYNYPNPALAAYYLANAIGNLLETTVAIERLICAGILDRFPRIRFLLVHAGGYFPWQAGRLRHAAKVRPELAESPSDPLSYLDRIWFDSITHDVTTLRLLVERVGAERVVIGTDLPFDMAPPAPLDEIEAGITAPDAREQITATNAAALFGL
jgi:aminocarboxymuconate-semialdehyde decarboxylase